LVKPYVHVQTTIRKQADSRQTKLWASMSHVHIKMKWMMRRQLHEKFLSFQST